jgi:hypothetical protein
LGGGLDKECQLNPGLEFKESELITYVPMFIQKMVEFTLTSCFLLHVLKSHMKDENLYLCQHSLYLNKVHFSYEGLTWIYALPNFLLIFLIRRMLIVRCHKQCVRDDEREDYMFANTKPCKSTAFSKKHPYVQHRRVSQARKAAPYLKRLVAGFPLRRPGFKPGSSHVGFVVDKVALGQVFSEYFGFHCQSTFHQFLHNHSHLSSGAGTIGQ